MPDIDFAMKWFWCSLLVFCLLMCSCKSKKMVSEVSASASNLGYTGYARYSALADTSRVLRIEMDKSKLRIVETLKVTEYDKESGKPIKETEAKRETTQDSDKVAKKEEAKGISVEDRDSLNHIANVRKKVESEVKEEVEGGQEAFGKWFGIGIACVIGLLVVYLMRKLRVN